MTSDHLEAMALTLEATADYRVLRRLKPCPSTTLPPGVPVRLGMLVDVETTGLDPQRDQIIELALMPFKYGLDGTVFSVGDSFQGLREPSEPITLRSRDHRNHQRDGVRPDHRSRHGGHIRGAGFDCDRAQCGVRSPLP